MTQKTLAEYVSAHGQSETARRAGLSQGAIWQMLKSDRKVYVTEQDDGTVALEEVRPIRRTTSA